MNRLAQVSTFGCMLIAACGCAGEKKGDGKSVPMAAIKPAPSGEPREATPITLKAADPAPALSVDQWLKGAPVSGFEKGRVYVVEFWATWCPPCIASIPHLNQLQADHPEVVVIGVAGSERKPSDGQPDTRVDSLKRFIDQRGDGMNYRVAYDSDRTMAETWMRPAGQNGIPCAFIVGRDGRLAWIGHPMAIDAPLAAAITAPK